MHKAHISLTLAPRTTAIIYCFWYKNIIAIKFYLCAKHQKHEKGQDNSDAHGVLQRPDGEIWESFWTRLWHSGRTMVKGKPSSGTACFHQDRQQFFHWSECRLPLSPFDFTFLWIMRQRSELLRWVRWLLHKKVIKSMSGIHNTL